MGSKRHLEDYPVMPAAGPSTNPSKAPPAKRQRKKKDAEAPIPEKREARFKSKCPQAILERVDRVAAQRFFMIDRKRDGDELHEEFNVLGSTGNVYTVVIDKRPSCNCPDFGKGNHCKHILFIFMKVLQVPYESSHWYQKALLSTELAEIFAQAPLAPNSVAHPHIRDAYARATGKKLASTSAAPNQKRRMPSEEDDCPICYENMHKEDVKKLAFCESCGNGLHLQCFQQWARSKVKPDCVFCRAEWVVPGPAGAKAGRSAEGYVNLAGVAGLSPQRDTSSYYHGPRRGQRYYGYQNYEELF
ncbi:hypothetical protein OE88DRAFT_1667229 [Heliocybe sulcata]|uniref:SWIM-type domain-containing protein n=1 Tax=Heliocybe sulcata TaxID=5364 RepID=A0A5C3MS76_9AGAM|nr:hypothetical protein OE88DRAFT_1667229 [Heliocybe sulcata]